MSGGWVFNEQAHQLQHVNGSVIDWVAAGSVAGFDDLVAVFDRIDTLEAENERLRALGQGFPSVEGRVCGASVTPVEDTHPVVWLRGLHTITIGIPPDHPVITLGGSVSVRWPMAEPELFTESAARPVPSEQGAGRA